MPTPVASKTRRSTVDSGEVQRFAAIAPAWWDENGPFRPLHRLNPARLGYIRDRVAGHFGRDIRARTPFSGLKLLDIGCGGGLISEPLARLGFAVTGIDADSTALAVAREHAEAQGLAIDYRATTAEALAAAATRFDVVLALEIVEHVADPALFLAAAAELLAPRGALILSTLNRTPEAFVSAIIGAEYLLRWLPRGTHSFAKFRRPSEMARDLRAAGLQIGDISSLFYDPLQGGWRIGTTPRVNYLLFATAAD